MSSVAVIVSGEASETDSDDDTLQSNQPELLHTLQASVIHGEDSESDNEVTKPKVTFSSKKMHIIKEDYTDSLLHKKLRECNFKLYKNVNHFAESVLADSEKTLMQVDNELIKCQLTMQNAVSALQNLSSNSQKIKNKLDDIFSSSFLSNLKT